MGEALERGGVCTLARAVLPIIDARALLILVSAVLTPHTGWCGGTPTRLETGAAVAPTGGPHRLLTADDMLRVVDVGGAGRVGASVAPNAKWAAFMLRARDAKADTTEIAWYAAPLSIHAAANRISDGGDPELYRDEGGTYLTEHARWSPNSEWFAYRKKVGGGIQVWAANPSRGLEVQVTSGDGDVQQFEWSPDSQRIIAKVTCSESWLRSEVYQEQLSGFHVDQSRVWDLSMGRPNDASYRSACPTVSFVTADIATRTMSRATATDESYLTSRRADAVPDDRLGFSRVQHDGSSAWLHPADPRRPSPDAESNIVLRADRLELRCKFEVCSGRMLARWNDRGSETAGGVGKRLAWSEDGKRLYFLRQEGLGAATLYEWTIAANSVRAVLRDAQILRDCSIVSLYALCLADSPIYPVTLVRVSLLNGTIETYLDPNPWMKEVSTGVAERFDWTFGDGQAAFGTLIKPVEYVRGQRYPLVVIPYRAYRAFEGGTGAEYPAHLFASNGFLVLAYDYVDPASIVDTQSYVKNVSRVAFMSEAFGRDLIWVRPTAEAVSAAIRKLVRVGLVDSKRVGLAGFSDGAKVAQYLAIHSRGIAAMMLSSADWSPCGWYLQPGNAEWKQAMAAGGLGAPNTPNVWNYRNLSLSQNVSSISAPILINASSREYPFALQDLVTLRDVGKPIDMFVYADERHVKWHPAHLLAIYKRNVDWMRFWLQGRENPVSAQAEQYKRWRAMRVKQCETFKRIDAPWYCR